MPSCVNSCVNNFVSVAGKTKCKIMQFLLFFFSRYIGRKIIIILLFRSFASIFICSSKFEMMKIPFLCLLLVILPATVISQDASIKARYKKFITQHIDRQMTAKGCDNVLRKRKITKTDSNECKETNTFILAETKKVRSICLHEGQPYGNKTKSLKPFHIIVCNIQNVKARYPKCRYRGKSLKKRVIIKCEKGFPVHYDGDIGHCET
ncbi:Ribonuclease-like 3 [Channa argus]|uniref:Ribonuclease-like 3 n=1 Tax=Channa argus TaxID=215402 RepID=A0A6G1PUX5_CHAAH|nr:Ribonuclease-like 3 [Channa argus]